MISSLSVDLQLHITRQYILPELTSQRVHTLSMQMFNSIEPKTKQEIEKLKYSLYEKIKSEINLFLKTDEALKINRHANHMDAQSSYGVYIRGKINERLEDIYKVSTKQALREEERLTYFGMLKAFGWRILGY